MTHVLTLVASDRQAPVTKSHFKEIERIIYFYNIHFSSQIVWLEKKVAAEVGLSEHAPSPLILHLRELLADDKIDFFVTKNENRRKKLLMADMDSTIVEGETLDELAKYANIKDKIAEITARAMNGEIDFKDALRERVGLLKGLDKTALNATLVETKLNQGADILVGTMRKQGATCVLVSGGFTYFTEKIAEECGFQYNHGNTLEIKNKTLTGNVVDPILDKHAKVDFLEHYVNDLKLGYDDALAVGDGANDLPMLKKSGLGIGYHPKENVKSELENCILYGNLTALLFAQGYSSKHFEI